MKYANLGRTGLRVSEISLGTAEIGLAYGIGAEGLPDAASASRLLNFALDHGINTVDTARAYGESEARIGEALSTRRSEFVLVSKVQAGTPEQIRQSVEESLRNLRTDVIDVMMIHSAPKEMIEEGLVASVLEQLCQEGSVRSIGVSVYGPDAAIAAVLCGSFSCVQLAYSLLDRRAEVSVGGLAKEHGVSLVARSVLLKGALTEKSCLLPESFDELRQAILPLNRIAADANISLPELAYRYVLGTRTVDTALVGARCVDEVEQAIRFAASGPLPPSVVQKIQAGESVNEFWLNPGNWPAL